MNDTTQRGSVLILALWALLFLGVLTTLSGGMVRQQMRVIAQLERRALLYEIARTGVLLAFDVFESTAGSDGAMTADALNSPWASNPYCFKRIECGRGWCTVGYRGISGVSGQAEKRYGIVDEERKINLNYAPQEVIERLLSGAGMLDPSRAGALAAAIGDWRDPDDMVNGSAVPMSESAFYRGEGYPYGPRNTDFTLLQELCLVAGMDQDVFGRIADFVTVYGTGKININTASEVVLQSLGLSKAGSDALLLCRAGMDRIEGTMDDQVFSSLAEVRDGLQEVAPLSPADRQVLTDLLSGDLIGVRSSMFMVRSRSELYGAGLHGTIVSVFDRALAVRYWDVTFSRNREEQ